jgi:hypothetical protein
VRLVRSVQTRVHTRVRQLLGRSAGEDVDVRKDWSSARCVPSWTAPAHEITARSLMRRPSDGPNALPPTASVFRRGQSRRSIRCRIDRSGVRILCYCADSRGRNNRSGAAIAVPHRGSTHIVERSLWVAISALRVVSSGFNRRPPGITRPQHPPTPRELPLGDADTDPAHARRWCSAPGRA